MPAPKPLAPFFPSFFFFLKPFSLLLLPFPPLCLFFCIPPLRISSSDLDLERKKTHKKQKQEKRNQQEEA